MAFDEKMSSAKEVEPEKETEKTIEEVEEEEKATLPPKKPRLMTVTVASILKTLATFRVGGSKGIELQIARGSVVDFDHPYGAIVNAANEGCLGGGGVDGAISNAGGRNLYNDRLALPIVGNGGIRCPTGQAKLTGPGDYGDLNVPFVVHAVGPQYFAFENFVQPDQLLRSAYQSSLECCRSTALMKDHPMDGEKEGDDSVSQPVIKHVAFSLLSAGVFKGDRSLKAVLGIGVEGIRDWVEESQDCGALESITLCAFNPREASTLIEICEELLGPTGKEGSGITNDDDGVAGDENSICNSNSQEGGRTEGQSCSAIEDKAGSGDKSTGNNENGRNHEAASDSNNANHNDSNDDVEIRLDARLQGNQAEVDDDSSKQP